MSNTKIVILTSVILATLLFVVFGIREVKKNDKKSFDDTMSRKSSSSELNDEQQNKEYTLEEIISEIK